MALSFQNATQRPIALTVVGTVSALVDNEATYIIVSELRQTEGQGITRCILSDQSHSSNVLRREVWIPDTVPRRTRCLPSASSSHDEYLQILPPPKEVEGPSDTPPLASLSRPVKKRSASCPARKKSIEPSSLSHPSLLACLGISLSCGIWVFVSVFKRWMTSHSFSRTSSTSITATSARSTLGFSKGNVCSIV